MSILLTVACLSLKHVRTFKNNATGLSLPNLNRRNKLLVHAELNVWDQDIYGFDGTVSTQLEFCLPPTPGETNQ